jgi:hypothetical protein
LRESRPILFWASILLALATKEEMVIPIAAFGAYCCLNPRYRKQGMGLVVLAAIWAVVCFVFVMPYFSEGRPYRHIVEWTYLLRQGATQPGGELTESTAPMDILSPDSLRFLMSLVLPIGFLPLLGPSLLAICLPSLTYLLLGKSPALHSIGYHYPAVLLPWLFLAAIEGLAWLERRADAMRKKHVSHLSLALLLTGTLAGALMFNPVVYHRSGGNFGPLPYQDQIVSALAQIPAEAGVATINAFGSHLAHRRYLISLEWYDTPLPQEHLQYIDYVLLDLVDCRAVRVPGPRKAYSQMVLDLLDSHEFGAQYWSGRILLLKRGLSFGPELEEIEAMVNTLLEEDRACWP